MDGVLIKMIFETGNILIGTKTGNEYEVLDSDIELSYAILKPIGGKPFMIDWLTPAGTIRKEIFEMYKLK